MSLEVSHLCKRFADRFVVHDVSFAVSDGELVALLGPSGSGKSTILRMVAGLTVTDAGSIKVDGNDVTGLQPQARDLGFVFQNYALFDHLSVADNIEFALRVRGMPRPRRRQRRDELLEMVGLGGSARKYPAQLSGGQRQRTALARALAHQPGLLLLDEPFGALDARIRQELRQELRELLKRLDTTAIFVTHDQEEAFAVADRILVLHRGRLLEQGEPRQLYQFPRSEFAASFVGRANLLPGELTPKGVRVRLAGERKRADVIPRRIKVLLRPEEIWLDEPDARAESAPGRFVREGEVLRTEYLGSSERVYLELEALVAAGTVGSARRFRVEVLRSIEESQLLPVSPGDRVSLVARQLHAVSQPDLRVLVVAGADAEGRQLVEAMLGWGERNHVLVTVLGAAAADPGQHARLEHYRQAYAGDLRLIDSSASEQDAWAMLRQHLHGERYDLVVLPANLREAAALLEVLSGSDVQHLLLAGEGDLPLLAGHPWQLILNAFSAYHSDLDLLAELAEKHGAQVEVRELPAQSVSRHNGSSASASQSSINPTADASRWRDVFATWQVRYTERTPATSPGQGPPVVDAETMAVLDLGPRASLGARQQAWLAALAPHWLWLVVQPDESDLRLQPMAGYSRQPLLAAEASVLSDPSIHDWN